MTWILEHFLKLGKIFRRCGSRHLIGEQIVSNNDYFPVVQLRQRPPDGHNLLINSHHYIIRNGNVLEHILRAVANCAEVEFSLIIEPTRNRSRYRLIMGKNHMSQIITSTLEQ